MGPADECDGGSRHGSDGHRAAWAGPVYGLLLWLSFEFVLAPALKL